MATTTKLSDSAKVLLKKVQRNDVAFGLVDERAFNELRAAGLANVIFGSTGNWAFATSAGKAAR